MRGTVGLVAALAVALACATAARGEALELLPDLDVVEPRDLGVVETARGRFHLGFSSAVDNLGLGPVIVEGRRRAGEKLMTVRQRVVLAGGGSHVYDGAGWFRYVRVATHEHWHYLPFAEYELRPAATAALAVRDRKMGFCISDRHRSERAPRGTRTAPRYLDFCGFGRPDLLTMRTGESVGYSDRYGPQREGQYVDLTGLPAGRYVLVHRANPSYLLREIDYTNDASSLLLRLAWPHGERRLPRVAVLETCPDEELCGIPAVAAGMLGPPR